jgi:hemolysin type calcium-binding protein
MAIIFGTETNDTLSGTAEDDVIEGAGGSDTISGGDGNDTLFGDYFTTTTDVQTPDGDILSGGAGNDNLIAGAGDDVLDGGAGMDVLIGGEGADTFKFSFTTESAGQSESFTDWLKANGSGTAVSNGELADGTTQAFFSTKYTEWLQHLVKDFGLGVDMNGDGQIKVGLNQNDPAGTPQIEGLSAEQLADMFSDPETVLIKTGKTTHERYYSDTFTSSTGGEAVPTGLDGHDFILDFEWGLDTLSFSGLGTDFTLDQFEASFEVTQTDYDGDGQIDLTVLALANGSWSATIWGITDVHSEADFYGQITFG